MMLKHILLVISMIIILAGTAAAGTVSVHVENTTSVKWTYEYGRASINPENVYDDDYTTYGSAKNSAGENNAASWYLNYTNTYLDRPGLNITWNMKWDQVSNKQNNVSIPARCANTSNIQLLAQSYIMRDGADQCYTRWLCHNTTAWELLYSSPLPGDPCGLEGAIYEESLTFNYTVIDTPAPEETLKTGSGYMLTAVILLLLLAGFLFGKNTKAMIFIVGLGSVVLGLFFLLEVVL